MNFLTALMRAGLILFLCHTATSLPTDQHHDKTLNRRMQPDAVDVNPHRLLEWGEINFIHTTDLHGCYEGHMKERNYRADWGDFISFIKHMRDKAKRLNVDLLVVDSGKKMRIPSQNFSSCPIMHLLVFYYRRLT